MKGIALAALLLLTASGIAFAQDVPDTHSQVVQPSVLITSSSLSALRRDLTKDDYRRNLYEQHIKAHADDWLTRPVRIPARAGYYHDFVCRDGVRLIWPDGLKHCEPIGTGQKYKCPECGQEYEGEKFDGAIRCLQHNDLMTAARDLALVGALSEDQRYARKSAEILRAYARAYPGQHTAATKGGILLQSLDEAVHFIDLVQAYDLIKDVVVLSPEVQKIICEKLLWECAEGLVKCGVGGNWGSWHLSAVGVIGFATNHQRFADYGVAEFKKQLATQLGSDGLWPESVHTYHFYPLRGFLHLAEAARGHGIDLYQWEASPGKGLKAMLLQPVQYAYPNLQLPAINDGWYASYLPLDVYELAYDRLGDPELAWVVKESRKRNTEKLSGSPDANVLWGVLRGASVTGDAAPDLHSMDFSNIGICTLRWRGEKANDTMVTFDYGRFLGHGQADKMGVTLYSGGRVLMADYGTPSYGSAILPYYKGTMAHNTIIMDGKNQVSAKDQRLLGFFDSDQVKLAVAETTGALPGVTWRRAVALLPEGLIVSDQLSGDGEHQFDSQFHCIGKNVNLRDAETTPVMAEILGHKYFRDVRMSGALGQAMHVEWSSDDNVILTGLMSASMPAVYMSAVAPGTSERDSVPVVVQRVKGKSAIMTAVFLLPGYGESLSALPIKTGENGIVSIELADKFLYLHWKANEVAITVRPEDEAGEVHAVPFSKNSP